MRNIYKKDEEMNAYDKVMCKLLNINGRFVKPLGAAMLRNYPHSLRVKF